MTNLIITSSFVVGFYSSVLFLVFQVSLKGWKVNFSFKSQKVVFKDKKHNWPFFSIFTPNFTVSCIQINHTHHKEISPRISLIISQMFFFWKFCFENFCPLKKKVSINIYAYILAFPNHKNLNPEICSALLRTFFKSKI